MISVRTVFVFGYCGMIAEDLDLALLDLKTNQNEESLLLYDIAIFRRELGPSTISTATTRFLFQLSEPLLQFTDLLPHLVEVTELGEGLELIACMCPALR